MPALLSAEPSEQTELVIGLSLRHLASFCLFHSVTLHERHKTIGSLIIAFVLEHAHEK